MKTRMWTGIVQGNQVTVEKSSPKEITVEVEGRVIAELKRLGKRVSMSGFPIWMEVSGSKRTYPSVAMAGRCIAMTYFATMQKKETDEDITMHLDDTQCKCIQREKCNHRGYFPSCRRLAKKIVTCDKFAPGIPKVSMQVCIPCSIVGLRDGDYKEHK